MSKFSKEIYNSASESEKDERQKIREEILRSVGINEEYFEEGIVKIDERTCRGVECKLCIEACPTKALYWDEGMVKIEVDLCIFCNACVLSCIVDNCIIVTRKRKNGEIEKFGTPREVLILMGDRAVKQRGELVKEIMTELSKTSTNKH